MISIYIKKNNPTNTNQYKTPDMRLISSQRKQLKDTNDVTVTVNIPSWTYNDLIDGLEQRSTCGNVLDLHSNRYKS
jgi:hypothetical protein